MQNALGVVFFDIGETLGRARLQFHSPTMAVNDVRVKAIDVYRYVPRVLQDLREQGIRLGIISNTPSRETYDSMRAVLADAGIYDFFEADLLRYSSYLDELFRAPVNRSFNAVAADLSQTMPTLELRSIKHIPLTQSVAVEYEQTHCNIPVHGACVGVELTPGSEFLGVSGCARIPRNVNPVASISPRDALGITKQICGLPSHRPLDKQDAPRLVFRHDPTKDAWRLAYVFDDVSIFDEGEDDDLGHEGEWEPHTSKYRVYVDAHSGEEIIRVPLRKLQSEEGTGADYDGNELRFRIEKRGNDEFILIDTTRNIITRTLGFDDVFCGPTELPGADVVSETAQFSQTAAVVAHAHAAIVYDFYNEILQRDGIDGEGGPITSTVDCLDYKLSRQFGICRPFAPRPANDEWRNAAWTGEQMVYGQRVWPDETLHSYAKALDVVGHELTHGVIDRTADLEYVTASGALNESYADVIGVAIANRETDDPNEWEWRLATQLDPNGTPLRNIRQPDDPNLVRPQPAHNDNFRRLPPGERPSRSNDNGFVHHNSGIPNLAAFNLYTSGVIDWRDVVRIFYLTLSVPGRLSTTSGFSDARAGAIESCRALFRDDADVEERVAAVEAAYTAVGID